MALQLDSLEKSIDSLHRSLKATEDNLYNLSPDLQETVRAGVIQNFEVAYELCWKFIQRWLKENSTTDEASHPRTRKELFRMAARIGLIEDPAIWFEYSAARNLTSHTYDAKQADIVYQAAGRFIVDAQALLRELKTQND